MKKCFVLIIAILIVVFTATSYAAEIDLSSLTEEELKALIQKAQTELAKFDDNDVTDARTALAVNDIMFEDENVRITYSKEINIDQMFKWLNIPVIVENLTDDNLFVTVTNVSCNGWAVFDATVDVPAGKKAKTDLCFIDAVENAELTSASDVAQIEGAIYCLNSDTFSMTEQVPFVWVFSE